jgi:hypothetical protein
VDTARSEAQNAVGGRDARFVSGIHLETTVASTIVSSQIKFSKEPKQHVQDPGRGSFEASEYLPDTRALAHTQPSKRACFCACERAQFNAPSHPRRATKQYAHTVKAPAEREGAGPAPSRCGHTVNTRNTQCVNARCGHTANTAEYTECTVCECTVWAYHTVKAPAPSHSLGGGLICSPIC